MSNFILIPPIPRNYEDNEETKLSFDFPYYEAAAAYLNPYEFYSVSINLRNSKLVPFLIKEVKDRTGSLVLCALEGERIHSFYGNHNTYVDFTLLMDVETFNVLNSVFTSWKSKYKNSNLEFSSSIMNMTKIEDDF